MPYCYGINYNLYYKIPPWKKPLFVSNGGMTPTPPNGLIACIAGFKRHLAPPFNFVCFTDEYNGLESSIEARDIKALTFAPELSGIWWKLSVMHPDAKLRGQCLFLDLDTVIVDGINCFFHTPVIFALSAIGLLGEKKSSVRAPKYSAHPFFVLSPMHILKPLKFLCKTQGTLKTEKNTALSRFL